MNPLLRDQIDSLRRSPDARDKSQATVLEMLIAQDETLASIKDQTTKTNGRVTRHDATFVALTNRLDALEKPAMEIATLWRSGKGIIAILTAVIGLVAGGFGLISGTKEPDKAAIREIIIKAIAEQAKAEQAKP